MTLHTFPALQFRPSYGRFSSRTAGTLLIVIICSLLASTGRAEVSMTFAGYKISYSSGSFNMSEEYGQQFIDVENLVISSQQGERLTADRLMLKATGTLHSLDWIEQADIINANLNMPPSSGHEIETRIETIQIKNMHLSQPESLSGFAERLHKDRVRPGYLRLANVFLLLPESGLLVEIEELVADSNPDLMNSQLPRGQHVSEAAIVKARLLPSGSGETSLMFRFMLNGLGLDALTIDARASALSKFTSGQFDGEFRLELDADK
ncbi:MAG: hypothetical protein VXW11_06135, partial [Pseudomonadota bacterium]|nr:hypothetical protein [Pseudomonadota bacterium]